MCTCYWKNLLKISSHKPLSQKSSDLFGSFMAWGIGWGHNRGNHFYMSEFIWGKSSKTFFFGTT
jgi:hypothetical protein